MSLNTVFTKQAQRAKKVKSIANALLKLADRAEALDLRLANGGMVDSWLTEIAAEIIATERA